jgi:hypothetical protein
LFGLNGSASVAIAVALVLMGAARSPRAAGDRLAVLIVADGDPALSHNLTEIAISKLAQRREYRLVGWREIHVQLADVFDGPGIGDCLDQLQCLARIGAAAHADSALIGDVRRQGDRFAVRLIWLDTSTGVRYAEFSEDVGPEVADLISAVRRGAGVVSTPKPTTLTLRLADTEPTLPAASSPASPSLVPTVHAAPRRARWAAPLGYTAGGLALVSLSLAVVTGTRAEEKPVGSTRAAAQSDLEQRDRYAGIANGLYLSAAALGVAALIVLVLQHRHE